MITYREISLEELSDRIMEIDVSEHGSVVYYWVDGELKALPEEWDRPKRTKDSWHNDSWTTVMHLRGVRAWGAFEDGHLTGMVVYRPQLTDEMTQLAALFMSKEHRRKGIASMLTHEIVRQAKEDGYSRLYVSATPSESAVNFYLKQGFVPTQQPHPELYQLEPEDIHMIMSLS